MKKTVLSAMVITMLILLISCQSVAPAEDQPQDAPTEPSVEMPSITISDEAEYLAFIASAELPPDFVPYEHLSGLGTFQSFYTAASGAIDQYMYTLHDAHDDRLTLYVDHPSGAPTVSTQNYLLSEPATVDLRHRSAEDSGYLVTEHGEYCYVKGELLSIEFQMNGVHFTLCGDMMLADYPTSTTDTLVSRLLIPALAEEAMREMARVILAQTPQ